MHSLVGFLSALLVLSVVSGADIKQYSYLCIEVYQDVCLGISPGNNDPTYDPANLFQLQIKSRTRNEFTSTDYKKTRWDVNYATSHVNLSKFSNLCISKSAGGLTAQLDQC